MDENRQRTCPVCRIKHNNPTVLLSDRCSRCQGLCEWCGKKLHRGLYVHRVCPKGAGR